MTHVYNWVSLYVHGSQRQHMCEKVEKQEDGKCKDEGEAHLDDSHCSPLTCAVSL